VSTDLQKQNAFEVELFFGVPLHSLFEGPWPFSWVGRWAWLFVPIRTYDFLFIWTVLLLFLSQGLIRPSWDFETLFFRWVVRAPCIRGYTGRALSAEIQRGQSAPRTYECSF
jgi:hypothetical protein